MEKILIIEDDEKIASSLAFHLTKWDFDTFYIKDFKNILDKFLEYEPHLVLMDISLPFYNGFFWCNEIRKISKVPIMFISSASDNMNIVMAINMGADDFIAKPFDLNVLTAKVQALIRRAYAFNGKVNILQCDGVTLNLNEASLLYKDKKLELTKNEFKIMQILMENKGKIISRDDIMIKLWESESFIDDNTLTVNITRLRKKMSDELLLNEYIVTKKGLGYVVL